jgi:hypothetical protein
MQNGYSANVAGRNCEVHSVAFPQDRPGAVDFLLTTSGTPAQFTGHDLRNFANAFVAQLATKRETRASQEHIIEANCLLGSNDESQFLCAEIRE